MLRIGLIADTHGLLRPQTVASLHGCDLIVHGGDIGRAEILEELAALAPVRAVRGNNDVGPWAQSIPTTDVVQVGTVCIYVLHNLAELDLDPAAAGFHAVVAGHSHKPSVDRRAGVLYVNPGSCGPRRFKLPVSIAELTVDAGVVHARIVELDIRT